MTRLTMEGSVAGAGGKNGSPRLIIDDFVYFTQERLPLQSLDDFTQPSCPLEGHPAFHSHDVAIVDEAADAHHRSSVIEDWAATLAVEDAVYSLHQLLRRGDLALEPASSGILDDDDEATKQTITAPEQLRQLPGASPFAEERQKRRGNGRLCRGRPSSASGPRQLRAAITTCGAPRAIGHKTLQRGSSAQHVEKNSQIGRDELDGHYDGEEVLKRQVLSGWTPSTARRGKQGGSPQSTARTSLARPRSAGAILCTTASSSRCRPSRPAQSLAQELDTLSWVELRAFVAASLPAAPGVCLEVPRTPTRQQARPRSAVSLTSTRPQTAGYTRATSRACLPVDSEVDRQNWTEIRSLVADALPVRDAAGSPEVNRNADGKPHGSPTSGKPHVSPTCGSWMLVSQATAGHSRPSVAARSKACKTFSWQRRRSGDGRDADKGNARPARGNKLGSF